MKLIIVAYKGNAGCDWRAFRDIRGANRNFPCQESATLEEYLQLIVNRDMAQTQMKDLFFEKGITALLSPGAPHVALPHDMYQQYVLHPFFCYKLMTMNV
jgi:hypothetical protein